MRTMHVSSYYKIMVIKFIRRTISILDRPLFSMLTFLIFIIWY